MHRLYEFLRRHPTGVDSFWAVLLLGLCALTLTENAMRSPGERVAAVGVSLLMCTVVALRRRMPEKMLILAIVVGLAQLAFDVEVNLYDVPMLVIVYTVASGPCRWASRVALVGGVLAPVLYFWRWPDTTSDSLTHDLFGLAFGAFPFLLSWVLGDRMRTRRAYWDQLEERAARLEKEREQQAKMAVTAERARIARELHDVVAHNVSVMVVQADGAAYVLDSSPEQAKQALETISGTGRQALAEMRRLLGVLRTEDGSAPAGEYVPQPDVEQIEELVEQVRGAGLPVDYRVEGSARPLPSGVELTAYRIVQEALTNTRKHGGPDAGASVRLTYFDDGLGLLVEDDGRGAQHELYESGGADGMGHGLIGMRERVGMVGGTLDAGPRPGGGFRISVLLPAKPGR
ncbi:two-component sensor histidine kinase [Streptomyces mobaraensis NBRC 13819 = DSM 40847]|uniref:histidine kinase n=2 Tax=Streptomyces mobaraensis TaxID=35621 RepID=A0A5N5WAC9_STRMB|nr:sensor histidine kinase [Streptomyces mobaraensis]EMF01656.1 signal transduction histidine kinase [Streptomyces mobaraensis NBRC 13819 = DSM 40847]KAB7847806.1 two-component sensor histidine kinase [Streptomyces mobaraensis]QTT75032.1 two-component sensor histidine kinase [Streptomyces mobaraensis NBRC 13819 = DSM 40847]